MFSPIELSKRLVKLGCKSSANKWWSCDEDGRFAFSPCHDCTPAFHPWDFIANTEQASKNIQSIFAPQFNKLPEECQIICDLRLVFYDWRHKAIEASDFWKFVEESLEEE